MRLDGYGLFVKGVFARNKCLFRNGSVFRTKNLLLILPDGNYLHKVSAN